MKTISNFIFKPCSGLKFLYLTGNYLHVLNGNIFHGLKLLYLELSSNSLSVIDPHAVGNLHASFEDGFLELSNNDFQCNCNRTLLHTVMGVQSLRDKIVNYEQMTCLELGQSERFLSKLNVHLIENECYPSYVPHYITAIVSCIATLVSLVTCKFFHRKRYSIKSFIYKVQNRKYLSRNNFKYDCYVSSSITDQFWICDCLCKILEDNFKFNLCIPERDFSAGVQADEILRHMSLCRCILIVLSERYVTDGTCRFDLTLAYERLRRFGKRLIVIKMGQISPEIAQLDPKVFEILTSKNYTSYPLIIGERTQQQQDKAIKKQKLFWSKLESKIYQTMSKSMRNERILGRETHETHPMIDIGEQANQTFEILDDSLR